MRVGKSCSPVIQVSDEVWEGKKAEPGPGKQECDVDVLLPTQIKHN